MTPDRRQQALTALTKTKIALMARKDSVFYCTVCFSLDHHFDESVETAETNGTYVKYNPEFFLQWSVEQRLFILMHETLHVAFMHPHRLGNKNFDMWLQACDYAINSILRLAQFQLIPGVLDDPQYDGMSAEQIYQILMKDPPPPCSSGGGGSGSGGSMVMQDLVPPSASTPEEQQKEKDRIDTVLIRAKMLSAQSGEAPGSIPGELEFYINSLTNPKLPWYRILSKFTQNFAKFEYTYRRPNRRFFPDHILPSAHNEHIGNIATFTDSSGSVSDEEYAAYLSEVYPIVTRLRPTTLYYGLFDTKIQSVTEVRSKSDMAKIRFTGRGGTQIQPVLEWADKHKPTVLLVFSDGYFHHRPEPPKCPVIWIIRNNPAFTAPYGKVIFLQ